MARGYLAFVLHAHLPFVRHPEYPQFLEERWLFEAITETYLPIIRHAERAVADGVRFRLTVSISPSLLAMLEDPLLRERYEDHLERLVRLAEREQERTRNDGHFNWLATVYRDLFTTSLAQWRALDGRVAMGFRALQEAGVLELATCTATHGLLPMLAVQPRAVEAQLRTGLDYFESVMGFRARGLWLPECAYLPGIDVALRRHGIEWFCVEAVALHHASVSPLHGVHTPLYTPSGVAAFGRDQGSLEQVWSAQKGFPGDGVYREFYRDIGQDLDAEYIRSVMGLDVRADTGIKYHRITGRTAWKQPYDFHAARNKAAEHAGEFVHRRVAHVEWLASGMERPPIVVAPFDAELFGHWWFEGPDFLDFVVRKLAFDQRTIELVTPSDYLARHPVHQVGQPAQSTWGHQGHLGTWLSGKVDWIYDQILALGERMATLVDAHGVSPTPLVRRALNQALRELLLAQSSDFPFIISGGTAAQYAERRVRDHVARFHYLADALEANELVERDLAGLEELDNIFPDADYRSFSLPSVPTAAVG